MKTWHPVEICAQARGSALVNSDGASSMSREGDTWAGRPASNGCPQKTPAYRGRRVQNDQRMHACARACGTHAASHAGSVAETGRAAIAHGSPMLSSVATPNPLFVPSPRSRDRCTATKGLKGTTVRHSRHH